MSGFRKGKGFCFWKSQDKDWTLILKINKSMSKSMWSKILFNPVKVYEIYTLWTRFWFELLWGRNISIIRPDRCSTDASRGLNLRMLGTTLNTSLPSKPILSLHSAQPLWLHWCSNLSLIPRIFGNWNRTKILKCPDTQFCDKEGSTNDIFSARIQTIQVKEVGKWWFLTVGHGHYNGQNIIKATWHSIIFSTATRKDIKE